MLRNLMGVDGFYNSSYILSLEATTTTFCTVSPFNEVIGLNPGESMFVVG